VDEWLAMGDQVTRFGIAFDITRGDAAAKSMNAAADASDRLTGSLKELGKTKSDAKERGDVEKQAAQQSTNFWRGYASQLKQIFRATADEEKRATRGRVDAEKRAAEESAGFWRGYASQTSRVLKSAADDDKRLAKDKADAEKRAAKDAADFAIAQKRRVASSSFTLQTSAQQRAVTRQVVSTAGYTGNAAYPIGGLQGPAAGPQLFVPAPSGIGPLASGATYARMLRIQSGMAAAAAKADATNIGLQFTNLRTVFAQTWAQGKLGAVATSLGVGKLNSSVQNLSTSLKTAHDKFRGLGEAGMAMKGFGTQLAVGGGVVAGGAYAAAMAAGTYHLRQRGMNFMLGGEEAGKGFMEQLKQFDLDSPVTNFAEAIEQGQRQVGAGFRAQELVNKEGTGYFQEVSDALSILGGNIENFNAVFKQLGQARGAGVIYMRDIYAMAQSGGLPMVKILQAGAGKERTARALSGEEPFKWEEFDKAFRKGLEQFKGGSASAMQELPGKVSNLQSAFQKLFIAIGEGLPVVTAVVEALTGVVRFAEMVMNSPGLGDVLKFLAQLVVVAGAAGVPLGLLLIAIGQVAQGIGALTFIMETQLVRTLGLGNAMGLLGIGLVAAAVAAYGFQTAIEGTAAAAKLSDEELKKAYPFWSHVWNSVLVVAEKMDAVFDWLAEKATWLANKLTFGLVPQYKGRNTESAELDRRNFELEQQSRARRGLSPQTFEQWQAAGTRVGGGKSGGDKEATNANTAALNKNTVAMGDYAADMQVLERAKAKEEGAGIDTSAAPTMPDITMLGAPDMGRAAGTPAADTNAASAAAGMGDADYRALQLEAKLGDKAARKQLGLVNLFKGWEKADQKARAKMVAAAQKQAAAQRAESAIAQGFQSREDVGGLDEMHENLRALLRQRREAFDGAEKSRLSGEIEILTERIARANDAKKQMTKEEADRRKADRQLLRVQGEGDREYVTSLRRYLEGLRKSGRVTREGMAALLDRVTENLRRSGLGMPTQPFTSPMQALWKGFEQSLAGGGAAGRAARENPYVAMWRKTVERQAAAAVPAAAARGGAMLNIQAPALPVASAHLATQIMRQAAREAPMHHVGNPLAPGRNPAFDFWQNLAANWQQEKVGADKAVATARARQESLRGATVPNLSTRLYNLVAPRLGGKGYHPGTPGDLDLATRQLHGALREQRAVAGPLAEARRFADSALRHIHGNGNALVSMTAILQDAHIRANKIMLSAARHIAQQANNPAWRLGQMVGASMGFMRDVAGDFARGEGFFKPPGGAMGGAGSIGYGNGGQRIAVGFGGMSQQLQNQAMAQWQAELGRPNMASMSLVPQNFSGAISPYPPVALPGWSHRPGPSAMKPSEAPRIVINLNGKQLRAANGNDRIVFEIDARDGNLLGLYP
jgi:tape measure domain-containing protein